MRVEWDEAKNESNQKKHHIGFEEACQVFNDPLAWTKLDLGDRGEERWQTMGRIGMSTVVLVVHTIRDENLEEVYRIISARPTTSFERRLYEELR